jgi:uncharacterized RDD family membrane protein YckC
LRWLQKVKRGDEVWDAFETAQGVPFSGLVEKGKGVSWGTLRHWLHDLASELWAAAGDQTLPPALSLDHVWITGQGRAVLLDEPWPDVKTSAEPIPVGDLAGQQRFLNAVAAHVDESGLPLHPRPMLQNLKEGKFEKLSFLTGILRGLLERPAEVNRGIRAGSTFLIPLYAWIMVFVGGLRADWIRQWTDSPVGYLLISALAVLGVTALVQLLALPFTAAVSHHIFRLAVVNTEGKPSSPFQLLVRWAIVWLPLFLPVVFLIPSLKRGDSVIIYSLLAWLFLWLGAASYAVIHPNRGLHDRLAGTRVVRR